MDIFRQIRECSHHPGLRPHFFEFKIRELLFQLLLDHERTNSYESEPDETERFALKKAREIILSDISRHYTIGEIARSVQLNEFDLKTGFKKIWGMGIYETLLHARMEKAHDLLVTTNLPIKEIAFLTGYPRITSFIRSFRHFFHYTPGSLRRSRQ
jgi:AraC-like DNA-binding protein